MTAIGFVLVAAAFTVVRAVVTSGQPTGQIPWRTFGINVGGAFLLGLITTAQWFDSPIVVAIAGLGSLTTFSTIAAETAGLIDDGHKRTAIAYVGLTLVVGIAAAWLGLSIGDPS